MTESQRPVFAALALLGSTLAMAYTWYFCVIWTDDALIYFRIAQNVANGFGPVLNASDSHSAGTSIVWVYLLATATKIFPQAGLSGIAMTFSALFTFGSSLCLCFAFKPSVGVQALLAPLALISIDLFRLLPGLETSLAVFALSLALWCWFFLRSLPLAAAAVAFSFFCRGDAVLLGVPIGLHFLVDAFREKTPQSEINMKILQACLAAGGVLSAGFLIQWALTGELLPSTLNAKMVQGLGGKSLYASGVFTYAYQAVGSNAWFSILIVVGLARAGFPGFALVSTALLHALAYWFLSVADYPWYSWILQLSLALLLAFGLAGVVEWICVGLSRRLGQSQTRGAKAQWVSLLLSAGLASWLWLGLDPLPRFDRDPLVGGASYIHTYHRVAQHLCAGISGSSESERPTVFLGEEIGVIGFYCRDLLIRDINGLASPGLTIQNLDNWDFWVTRYSPHFLTMRGDQGLNRVFGGDGNATGVLYRRVMAESSRGPFPVTVYERAEESEESLSHLAPFLRHSPTGPDVKLLWIPGDLHVLFAHAPSEIRVSIPEWANQVELGFGLLPAPANAQDRADGVTFRIIGVDRNGEQRPMFEDHLSALITERPNGVHTARLDVSDSSLQALRLVTQTGPVPDWDWSYWSHVKFDK